jgi:hypothetical protein
MAGYGFFLKRFGTACCMIYVVGAVAFAILKSWAQLPMPWLEVVLGPAVTMSCCFLIALLACLLESWLRRGG